MELRYLRGDSCVCVHVLNILVYFLWTQAVLHYLREQLKECQGEEGEEGQLTPTVRRCP